MKLEQIFQFTSNPYKDNKHLENRSRKFTVDDIGIQTLVSNNRNKLGTDSKIWEIMKAITHFDKRKMVLYYGDDYGFAEMLDVDTNTFQYALVKESNGTLYFLASETAASGTYKDYDENHKGTILLAAMIAFYSGIYENVFDDIRTLINASILLPDDIFWDDSDNCDKILKSACRLTNIIYYNSKNHLSNKGISRLYINEIEEAKNNSKAFYYKPIIIDDNNTTDEHTDQNSTLSSLDYVGRFNLNLDRVLTPEEQSMVPIMSDSYQWNDWVSEVARDIQESTEFEKPFRSVLLGGPAGTGKSDGAMAIASLLGRPYVSITCDPDMDFQSLLGSTTYNTAEDTNKNNTLDIPSFADVEYDFENSFRRLFQRNPDMMDEKVDCYMKIHELLLEQATSDKKEIIFSKSPLLRAIENGWVVEVKEPTVIKRSSVLVKLNGSFDSSSTITLDNGEVIKKHPETVIIYTTNYDYDGCKPIQQSVLSRIDIIRDLNLPSHDVVVNRAMSRTGCVDKKAVSKMTKAIEEINEYCELNDIRDGVCGMRELMNWIQKSMLLEKRSSNQYVSLSERSICEAAHSTILSHTSQSYEDREDVISGAFKKMFSDSLVNETKLSYQRGLC